LLESKDATAVVRIDEEGEITLPRQVMDAWNMHEGDTLDIETQPDGTLRIIPKTLYASDVAGMLAGKSAVKSTIEEMDEAVADSFRKGHSIVT
jgi:AbrB family looped-hinge helix DNA binding protein